ncbi:CHAT domain-containing protein [Streptomyces sp. S.PB5]|uniref:CHAT domain-containing protein n=1 Tax=Streptomyces sp. S.PB5 TaxID=3020844 RepID=UPI0025B24207|nr:CHAT domain-containing protein [Streptomyces sp. S.PB5]MDN3028252.1 CHAT domain-containing protein [Streptomyces sp. S.PB5]
MLSGPAARIDLIEPLALPHGGHTYQLLQPRGANAWVADAFRGAQLSLRPDGSFRWGCRTDPVGSVGLDGVWTRHGNRVRLTALQRRTPGGYDITLDGLLDRAESADDIWNVDAILSGGGGFTRVCGRIRQSLAASGPIPRPVGDGTDVPAEQPSALVRAVSPIDTVWPVLDVWITPTSGFTEVAPRAGTILFAKSTEGRTFDLTLACTGPIGAGYIHWCVTGLERARCEQSGRILVRSVSALPHWYAQDDTPIPLALRDVEADLRYRAEDFTLHGTVTATGRDGALRVAEVAGGLQNPGVESLRAPLGRLGLSGSWRGALGPVTAATVPGPAYTSGSTELLVREDGELVLADDQEPYGFLRHSRAEDTAVGLAGVPGDMELVVLAREDVPVDLSELGVADAEALRHLAQEALADGLTATARPLLDHASDLLGEDTEQTRMSQVLLLNYQLRAAFELRDYDGMLRHLRSAVRLRQRLLREDTPWGTMVHLLGPDVARMRSMLELMAAESLRIRTMLQHLDDVAQTLVPKLIEPTEPAHTAELDSALTLALRAAADAGHRLSEQELTADIGLPPDLAEQRAALVHRVRLYGPENAHLLTALEKQEADFVSALRQRAGLSQERRLAAYECYIASCTLRSTALSLETIADTVERRRLSEAVEMRTSSSREGAAQLSGYIENWRSLLREDGDRIQSVERAQPFYEDLVRLMLDVDAPADALQGSELARARAFADLLNDQSASAERSAAQSGLTTDELIAACTATRRTVVEYFVHGEGVVAWVIPPTGQVTALEVGVRREKIAEAVSEFHTLAALGRPGRSERSRMADVLAWLGEILWNCLPDEALPPDPDEPVVVIPHGPLFRVPFAALRDRSRRHLAERHSLVLSPAIAMIPQLARRRAARARTVADGRLLALVNPSPMPLASLPALEWTQLRFGAVTTFYKGADRVVCVGRGASLAALRAHAPEADVLILATHAKALDTPGTNPMDSYIALAPSPGHDGMLRAREVFDLDIGADFVILSACETGAGLVTGDGVIGLSRAFLARGPTTLLMTLYEVREQLALDLVHRFHHHWRGVGLGAAAALRHAQLELLETFPDQPHLWAPFVLFGLDIPTEGLG